jgi:hypothetical protein
MEFFTNLAVTSLHTTIDEFFKIGQSSKAIRTFEMTGDTWRVSVGTAVGRIDGNVVVVGCAVGVLVSMGSGCGVGRGFSVISLDGIEVGF